MNMPADSVSAARDSGFPLVSIIVPTLASRDRRIQLTRAIGSVLNDNDSRVKVIVCVNGSVWDAACIEEIASINGVELHRLAEPSLPKAIAFGRSVVRSAYFGFLDDDDELLPGANECRLKVFLAQPECDVVISNGIRRTELGDETMLSLLALVSCDPLSILFKENWLPSCGGLFRSATIGQSYFDNYHQYAEWTWLAYRLAIDRKKIEALDSPTYVVNDTPGSLSKSAAYGESYISLYRRMLDCRPTPSIRKVILRRMATVLHDLSVASLKRGDTLDATRQHLQSILLPGGLRFASYSRHIVKQVLLNRN